MARRDGLGAEAVAVAHDEQLHDADTVPRARRNHVDIPLCAADVLALLYPAQADNLIPVTPGRLVVPTLGRSFHTRDELFDHRFALALQEHDGMAHIVRVTRLVHQPHTRRGAALDLVLQAGPGAVAEKAALALAHHEELLKKIERLAHRAGTGKGPEIAPFPTPGPAVKGEPRKRFFRREVYIRKALVVPEHDVVPGTVLLDEIVLEQQGLGFGMGGRHFDGDRVLHERAGFGRQLLGRAEIAGDALLQIARLADVEHLTADIEHAIHAGLAGQGAEKGGGIEGGGCFIHDRRRRHAHYPRWCGIFARVLARRMTRRNMTVVRRRVWVL